VGRGELVRFAFGGGGSCLRKIPQSRLRKAQTTH
jgi:hypothetical protein